MTIGLICRECGNDKFSCTDTRDTKGGIKRVRVCKDCGHKITTHEREVKYKRVPGKFGSGWELQEVVDG